MSARTTLAAREAGGSTMTAKAATKAQGKQTTRPPATNARPDTLTISNPDYPDEVKLAAMVAASPLVRGAVTGRTYSEGIFGKDTDLTAYMEALRTRADSVRHGDLKSLESMLATQANTLDMIFNHLARKANYSEYINQFQTYLSLALKAQAQSRTTVEALAELKNPRPVSFVKQANIANGPQQVNNGAAPPASPARAGNPAGRENGLLESDDGERMDARTAGEAGRSDKALEAVGKVNGAAH